VEEFIDALYAARFSHGLCPRCISEQYHDLPGQLLDEALQREA
jgi:hypothetical protein